MNPLGYMDEVGIVLERCPQINKDYLSARGETSEGACLTRHSESEELRRLTCRTRRRELQLIIAGRQARQHDVELVFAVRGRPDLERAHRLSHPVQKPRGDGDLLPFGRIRGEPDEQALGPAELAR